MPVRSFLLCLLSVVLFACSSADYHRMVPNNADRIAPTHQPLTVLPVKTSIRQTVSAPLEMATYTSALKAAMEKTGLFSRVQSEPVEKGFQLETSMTMQKLRLDDRVVHFEMTVRYAFVNRHNQVVFITDIRSHCSKSPSDHLVGATRERSAIECGVKKNLTSLMDQIYTRQHQFAK
ncbi:MAG: hypothetical protein OEZ39_01235 [Gammaproteobacteria bacterium]|nr:hypothetical protein [Gammaproteobacteria bacterium]MDH5650475.1 hypothetical protein [Gammaproteobacteria bacterium]